MLAKRSRVSLVRPSRAACSSAASLSPRLLLPPAHVSSRLSLPASLPPPPLLPPVLQLLLSGLPLSDGLLPAPSPLATPALLLAEGLLPAAAGCTSGTCPAPGGQHHRSCSALRERSAASAAAGGSELQPSMARLSRQVSRESGARPAAVWRALTRVSESRPVSSATC